MRTFVEDLHYGLDFDNNETIVAEGWKPYCAEDTITWRMEAHRPESLGEPHEEQGMGHEWIFVESRLYR